MSKSQTIFKFMSIRGVELGKETENNALFFKYEEQNGSPSKFVKSIQGKSDKKKKSLATEFLEATLSKGDFYNKPLYERYNFLNDIVQERKKEKEELSTADRARIKKIFKNTKAEITATTASDHWDLLIAASIQPDGFQNDRAKIIYPLRVLNIIKNMEAVLYNLDSVAKYLKSVPVIPTDLINRVKPEKPEQDSPDKPLENPLDVKVETYGKALLELDLLKRENTREIAARTQIKKPPQPKEKTKSKPTTKPASEVSYDEVFESDQIGINPFVFLPEVAKTMSKDTKSVLQELQLNTEDKVSEIARRVERQQQVNIAEATKGKGVKSIISMGGTFSSKPLDQAISGISNYALGGPSIPNTKGTLKPLGIGDLIVVEEELIKYNMHEIAHVENILKSEFKERVHRTFEQQEESYLFESETTSESETDLQKSERYELQKEAESVISQDQTISAGVSVSGGFGPVNVTANADYTISNSFQNSVSQASTYAQEITERSVNNIIERTLEQSTSKTLTEVEETNTHAFDNKEGSDHVIGIYRYLEKVYRAQMYNYGKRLMFECMIPEPAALYKHSLTNQTLPGMTLSMPDDEILNLSPADISRTGYLALVQLYQAQGVLPPPAQYAYVAKAMYEDYTVDKDFSGLADNELQVPAGYFADMYNVDRAYGVVTSAGSVFSIVVGDRKADLLSGDLQNSNLTELTGTVPILVKTSQLTNWGITIEVKCKLGNEKFEEWQMATFSALLDAYHGLKSAYEEQLASAKSTAGVGQFGQSDEMNRVTEAMELKRACITLLTDQHFGLFDAMEYPASELPQMNVTEAMIEGTEIQFCEQAFQWEELTYVFYPYFWGNKSKWIENLNIQNTDTKFQDFLKAGSARALIPVRPGYDEAVLHYLETGEIWEGGEVPGIEDEMYVSIIEELYEGHEIEKEPMGDSWELTVPTNLVYLQPDSTLPDLEAENETP